MRIFENQQLQLPIDDDNFMHLHSPEDLKHKVLVKGKRVTERETDNEDEGARHRHDHCIRTASHLCFAVEPI